jgi:hypothetical protein
MASYNNLTQEQKDKLAVFTTLLRGYYGELARFLDGLDAGAVVPNATGLAGAQALTKEELQAAVADMSALLNGYYTDAKRQVYDKMVGPFNTNRG